jgi:CTP:molybdopterin cytidylyltransferase MocA
MDSIKLPVHTFAIIPAAGRGRRMGFLKQLARVGGGTMLDAVLEAVSAGGVDGMALVTNAEVRARLDDRWAGRLLVVANDDPATEMIDSVRLGLAAWARERTIGPHDGFLVCPADHPRLSADDVRACVTAFRETPERIIIACLNGRRGHPIIFPAALTEFVQSPACTGGLNALPRSHADLVREVAGDSPGVTQDVDRRTDWDRMPE